MATVNNDSVATPQPRVTDAVDTPIPSNNGIGYTTASDPTRMVVPSYNTDLNSVNPTADLSYQTFLQGMGLSTAQAQAQAARQRSQLQSQLESTLPQYDQALKQGLTNDLNASANAGGVRSSARLLSQQNTQNTIDQQKSAFEQGIADKQAQLTDSLQNTLANYRIQQAQQQLAAQQRLLDTSNAQAAQDAASKNAAAYLAQYGIQ